MTWDLLDGVGDRCKSFEAQETARRAMLGLPLLARLDGRAFHTYTRGMARPFDERLSTAMQETTKALVEEFRPCVGYTQSDEITLAWYLPSGTASQYPFDGRLQKICSVMAGFASATFTRLADRLLPEKRDDVACFDARVWQVPSIKDALEVFYWREEDAVKNSVQMAARTVASHKQLDGKGRKDQLDILHAAGIRWNDYPAHFKRGVYFHRVTRPRTLTEEERCRIPEAHRPAPDATFLRSSVEALSLGPLRREPDAPALLFFAADQGPAAPAAPSSISDPASNEGKP